MRSIISQHSESKPHFLPFLPSAGKARSCGSRDSSGPTWTWGVPVAQAVVSEGALQSGVTLLSPPGFASPAGCRAALGSDGPSCSSSSFPSPSQASRPQRSAPRLRPPSRPAFLWVQTNGGSGRGCLGSVPGPGTSTCYGCGPNKQINKCNAYT